LIGLVRGKWVPFVPLGKRQMGHVNDYVQFDDPEKVSFVDLGSGDGRIVRLMEKKGVKDLTGYELNWWAHMKAKFFAKKYDSKANYLMQNFYNANFEKYDTVFCYLLSNAMRDLRKKFDDELKPGSRIISFSFPIENWREPEEVVFTNPKSKRIDRIFVYRID